MHWLLKGEERPYSGGETKSGGRVTENQGADSSTKDKSLTCVNAQQNPYI